MYVSLYNGTPLHEEGCSFLCRNVQKILVCLYVCMFTRKKIWIVDALQVVGQWCVCLVGYCVVGRICLTFIAYVV